MTLYIKQATDDLTTDERAITATAINAAPGEQRPLATYENVEGFGARFAISALIAYDTTYSPTATDDKREALGKIRNGWARNNYRCTEHGSRPIYDENAKQLTDAEVAPYCKACEYNVGGDGPTGEVRANTNEAEAQGRLDAEKRKARLLERKRLQGIYREWRNRGDFEGARSDALDRIDALLETDY